MMPRMSIIVCAHNEARYLGPCLHTLLAQTRPADEIVVINNASTDETRAVAQQIPHVRVVDEPSPAILSSSLYPGHIDITTGTGGVGC